MWSEFGKIKVGTNLGKGRKLPTIELEAPLVLISNNKGRNRLTEFKGTVLMHIPGGPGGLPGLILMEIMCL